MENCKLTFAIGEQIYEKYHPNVFITSHGIYSTWGPMYDFFKTKKIKSYVYAGKHSHALNQKYIYFTDSKVQTLTRSSFWNKYKNTQVTTEMKKKVDEYFKTRFRHATMDTKVYFGEEANILQIVKDKRKKFNIAIFPNSIWDGNIHDRHQAFEGIIDWLVKTVYYFRNREDCQVYIKFHPAEITFFKIQKD